MNDLFVALTVVGYAGAIWILMAAILAVALRRASVLVLTAAAAWSADLVALGLKDAFDRPRPFVDVPEPEPLVLGVAGASLPSGHAAASAAGAIVLSRFRPDLIPLFAVLAVAIGFSRLYVGVHYLTDVLAGFAVGAVAATALLMLAATRRRSAPAPPPG